MKALFIILNKTEYLDDILSAFLQFNVKGATIIESQGMASAISNSDVRSLPLFGSLRKLLNDVNPHNKTIFTVIKDDILEPIVAAVKELFKDESRKGSIFMFTVPVDNLFLLD